jgi:hypothetical protein
LDGRQTTYQEYLRDIGRELARKEQPGGTTIAPRPSQNTVLRARDRLTLPWPRIAMNPPVDWEQIVNFETWLWIDPATWNRRSARADAGSSWAEATAVPRSVVWDLGDGGRLTCPGPGTPYDQRRPAEGQATDCSYTYRRSSAGEPGNRFTVRATVRWSVSWQGSGGSGGDLGTVERTARVRVRVAELQALND